MSGFKKVTATAGDEELWTMAVPKNAPEPQEILIRWRGDDEAYAKVRSDGSLEINNGTAVVVIGPDGYVQDSYPATLTQVVSAGKDGYAAGRDQTVIKSEGGGKVVSVQGSQGVSIGDHNTSSNTFYR